MWLLATFMNLWNIYVCAFYTIFLRAITTAGAAAATATGGDALLPLSFL